MAYYQTFTLQDIFNNPRLKNKIPQVNIREIEKDDGKVSIRTAPKTVRLRVFEVATSRARPYYKPLKVSKTENAIILGGNMTGDINRCVNDIYNGLVAEKFILSFTANNLDMIRDATKEAVKNRRKYGNACRLYLRVRSMEEIEGMTKPQLNGLLENIMENIMYGDDFPMTQRKYSVESINGYFKSKENWKRRVGE